MATGNKTFVIFLSGNNVQKEGMLQRTVNKQNDLPSIPHKTKHHLPSCLVGSQIFQRLPYGIRRLLAENQDDAVFAENVGKCRMIHVICAKFARCRNNSAHFDKFSNRTHQARGPRCADLA
ncbi:hypothetical protein V8J88_08145 [Massilia sp. W12]|uniref:hypothetical protein n=1 Tax=Massilia sp. W12 TaxID=3126507 RepID=UPI0030CDB215